MLRAVTSCCGSTSRRLSHREHFKARTLALNRQSPRSIHVVPAILRGRAMSSQAANHAPTNSVAGKSRVASHDPPANAEDERRWNRVRVFHAVVFYLDAADDRSIRTRRPSEADCWSLTQLSSMMKQFHDYIKTECESKPREPLFNSRVLSQMRV